MNEENKTVIVTTEGNDVARPVTNDISTPTVATKKKKGNGLIIGLLICLIALCGIGVCAYFMFLKEDPQKVFSNSISGIFDYARENLKEQSGIVNGSGSINYTLAVNNEELQPIVDLFNGIGLKYEYSVDNDNNKYTAIIDSSYKNSDLVNVELTGTNERVYFLLKDIFDKYIYSDIEIESNEIEISKEDIIQLLNSTEVALIKSIDKNTLSTTSDTLTINGKNVNVVRNTMTITEKDAKALSLNILKELKDDANFISTVEKIANNTGFKEVLEEAIAEVERTELAEGTVTVSIFTKKFSLNKEFVGMSIEQGSDFASITKENNDTYSFNISSGAEANVTGKVQVVKTGAETKTVIDIIIPNVITIKLELSHVISSDKLFKELDTTNNIEYTEVSEEDINSMSEKLMTREGVSKLIENIQSLFGGNELVEQPWNDEYTMDTEYDLGLEYEVPVTIE